MSFAVFLFRTNENRNSIRPGITLMQQEGIVWHLATTVLLPHTLPPFYASALSKNHVLRLHRHIFPTNLVVLSFESVSSSFRFDSVPGLHIDLFSETRLLLIIMIIICNPRNIKRHKHITSCDNPFSCRHH